VHINPPHVAEKIVMHSGSESALSASTGRRAAAVVTPDKLTLVLKQEAS